MNLPVLTGSRRRANPPPLIADLSERVAL